MIVARERKETADGGSVKEAEKVGGGRSIGEGMDGK